MRTSNIFDRCFSAMLVGFAFLSFGSCTEDNEQQETGDPGVNVSFEVSVAQERLLSIAQNALSTQIAALARQQAQNFSSHDLATRRLEVRGLPNTCLIQTTTEGINAVLPQPDTRANVKTAIDARFSALGYRSNTPKFAVNRPEWFHCASTDASGTLVTPLLWAWQQPYARFYAVFPEAMTTNGITLSPATYSGTPYLDFEVKPSVTDQVDLMVASSGEVKYETRGQAPKARLEFYHALTAVKFAVGQNLSWDKHISKVELRNVCSKGRLHFTDETNGKGLRWDVDAASKTNFALTLSTPVSTSSMPNQVIVGNDGDNYTFYMIPQPLEGVTLHVEFSDADPIDMPLSDTWQPATTRTYKLSNASSNWNYSFTVTGPATAAAYNSTDGGTYTVESFRNDPSVPNLKHAVAWKIVGYEEYNYATNAWENKGMNKPEWFDGQVNARTQTEDYVAADQGQLTIQKMVTKDLLKERNDKLKEDAKGSSSNYYDLSMYDIKGNARAARSTANCYVISHPGFYKLPLVYGNGITNGVDNASSYTGPSAKVDYSGTDIILHKFKDHAGADIDNAWIEKTNGGANNGIDGAKIVWADEKDLVHFGASPIERSGNETYLKFEVKAADIKSGNAVVAVTKNGTIVWSWHLWFAPEYVLDPIPVVNYSKSHTYKFSTEPLGWKYTAWGGSVNQQPRRVKIRIQQLGSNQQGDIIITQNPGVVKEGSSTLYQFGRKDAFPGGLKGDIKAGKAVEPALYPTDHLFNKNAGEHISLTNAIQNPGHFYIRGTGVDWYPHGFGAPAGFAYLNLWSSQNTKWEVYNVGNDLPVVKSIYDPSPVGFHLPASNAFTRFTTTGKNTAKVEEFNVQGEKVPTNLVANYGWNFFADDNNTSTIFFPAAGYRSYTDGSLVGANTVGSYWSAVPNTASGGFYFAFNWQVAQPLSTPLRCLGASVRPVAE